MQSAGLKSNKYFHSWMIGLNASSVTEYSPAILGNVWVIFPNFHTVHVAKNIWRIINMITFIWSENTLIYLSLDIICSSKLTVFLKDCRQCSWTNIQAYFFSNGGYFLKIYLRLHCTIKDKSVDTFEQNKRFLSASLRNFKRLFCG